MKLRTIAPAKPSKKYRTSKPGTHINSNALRLLSMTLKASPNIEDFSLLSQICRLDKDTPLKPSSKTIHAIKYSPDGKKYAIIDKTGGVTVFDAETGEELFSLYGFWDDCHNVVFSSNSKYLIPEAVDRKVSVFSALDGSLVSSLSFPNYVSAVAISQNSKLVLGCCNNPASHIATYTVSALKTGKVLSSIQGNGETCNSLTFLPGSKKYATFGISINGGDFLSFRNVKSGKETKSLLKNNNSYSLRNNHQLKLFANNSILAAASVSTIFLIDLKAEKVINKIDYDAQNFTLLDAAPSKKRLIFSSFDTIFEWDGFSKYPKAIHKFKHEIICTALTRDCKKIFVSTYSGGVKMLPDDIWLIHPQKKFRYDKITTIAVKPESSSITIAYASKKLVEVKTDFVESLAALATYINANPNIHSSPLDLHKQVIKREFTFRNPSLEPKNSRLVTRFIKSSLADNNLQELCVAADIIENHPVLFKKDGDRAQAIAKDIWREWVFRGPRSPVFKLFIAYNRDGGSMASLFEDGSLRIWNLNSGELLVSDKINVDLSKRCTCLRNGRLWITTKDDTVRHYSLGSIDKGWEMPFPNGVKDLSFSSNSVSGVFIAHDKVPYLLNSGMEKEKIDTDGIPARGIRISYFRNNVAVLLNNNTIRFYNAYSGKFTGIGEVKPSNEVIDFQFNINKKQSTLYASLKGGKLLVVKIDGDKVTSSSEINVVKSPIRIKASSAYPKLCLFMPGGSVSLFSTTKNVITKSIVLNAPIEQVLSLSKTATYATLANRGGVRIWESISNKLHRKISSSGTATAIAQNDSIDSFAVGYKDGRIEFRLQEIRK